MPLNLLAAGSSLLRDNFGSTPLITLASRGVSSIEHCRIAEELIQAGDPINSAKSSDRMTPLCWASYYCDLRMVKLLLHPAGAASSANPAWMATSAKLRGSFQA